MFARPSILHALWILPALVLLRVWAAKAAGRGAAGMVASRLRAALISRTSPVVAWLIFATKLAALACFIIAVAQPRWGFEKRTITESGKNVIIAIDVSKSMLADDVRPNRLTRAKLAAQDMVAALKDQRLGIIAFAGRAYLQAPLTTDHAAVIESLQSLDVFTIPQGGSSLAEALQEAMDAFAKTKAHSHGLIVFSDGAEDSPELDAALKKTRDQHIITLTIGVGTEAGSLIPAPDADRNGDDFIRDPATGTPVHTKLEESTLQKMASVTGGRFFKLGTQSLSASVVKQALASLEAMETGTREVSKPIEQFYWPLGIGIFLLMIAMALSPTASQPLRVPAGALACFCLLAILPAHGARAAVLSDADSYRDASASYEARDYQRARDLYARLLTDNPPPARAAELAYGLGAATHQLHDYDRAVDAFSRALRSPDKDLQTRSHQSLGNTLYDQGAKALAQQPEFAVKAWTDSIAHYESALRIREDKKVRENMEFVKKRLEQLKAQQQQQQQQKGDKPQDKDGEKGDKQDQQDGSGQEEENEDQQGKQGQQKDGGKKDGEQKGGQKQDDQQDGKQGKGMQQDKQDGEQLPEGQVEANPPGDGKETKEQREARELAEAEGKQDQRTGFSRNEARALLRTYNDQMQLQFKQRRSDVPVKRDW